MCRELKGIIKTVTTYSDSMNKGHKIPASFKSFCGGSDYRKFIYRKIELEANKTAVIVANYVMDNITYNQYSAEIIPKNISEAINISSNKVRAAIKLLTKIGVWINWKDLVTNEQIEDKVLIPSKYWYLFNPLKFNYTSANMFSKRCKLALETVNDKDDKLLVSKRTAYPYKFPNTDYSDTEDVDLRKEIIVDINEIENESKD